MKPNLIEMLTQQKHSNSEYNPRKARKCPLCGETDLVLAERQGVEIDYCPKCRGVWLDRGELDKIVERSTTGSTELRLPRAPMSASRAATLTGTFNGSTKQLLR
jgi:Zn-finger nucleic acid-binding protein